MIALIDADSLIYSASYKRTPDEAVLYLTDRIDQICEKTEATEYALFLSIGSTFRHDTTEGYKSSRPKGRKEPVFYYIKEYMISALNAIYHKGVEADDLVTYWNNQMDNTIVCSPDKDVLYTNTRCYSYNKNEFVTSSLYEIDYFFWKQMLMGDSTDSIKGIPGCGDKSSNKLLESFKGNKEQLVITEYIEYFGMNIGIHMFYKNFKQLYILREKDDFEINHLDTPKQFKTVIRKDEL